MIVAACVAVILAASFGLAVLIGKGIRLADEKEEIRQPAVRDWMCSDGVLRTEAEAADWVYVTPGSSAWVDGDDSTSLDPWPAGNGIPDYVPSEWVA